MQNLGAAVSYDDPALSVDDLADQVVEVLDYFGLGAVMCLGVTAGSYVLTLFAIKYTHRVIGLILVSPLCKTPSWSEWLFNKVTSNVLYYYGTCGLVKELFLMRYYNKEVRGGSIVPDSETVQSCRRLLDEMQSLNVLRFLQPLNGRSDITEGLKRLQCRSLIFMGENSSFHSESLHMTSKLDRRFSALIELDLEKGMMDCLYAKYRKQFPVRHSFSMTINKAQGQIIPNVGYLPESVFSHGQLYLALSRGRSLHIKCGVSRSFTRLTRASLQMDAPSDILSFSVCTNLYCRR